MFILFNFLAFQGFFFFSLMRLMTLSRMAQSVKNATTARAHTIINCVTIKQLLRLLNLSKHRCKGTSFSEKLVVCFEKTLYLPRQSN